MHRTKAVIWVSSAHRRMPRASVFLHCEAESPEDVWDRGRHVRHGVGRTVEMKSCASVGFRTRPRTYTLFPSNAYEWGLLHANHACTESHGSQQQTLARLIERNEQVISMKVHAVGPTCFLENAVSL